MTTKPEPTKPTCVVCGSDDPNVREKIGAMMPMKVLRDDCYGSFHDKPPERAEWEILLHDATGLESEYRKVRAAVQRALDEREAATWRKAERRARQQKNPPDNPQINPIADSNFGTGFRAGKACIGDALEELAAAAEARAKGPSDGS